MADKTLKGAGATGNLMIQQSSQPARPAALHAPDNRPLGHPAHSPTTSSVRPTLSLPKKGG